MNAELEILGVKLKHYRVDAAMEIAEEYLSNDKLNTIGIVTMQMLMQATHLKESGISCKEGEVSASYRRLRPMIV